MSGYFFVFFSAVLYGIEPTVLEMAVERGIPVETASLMMSVLMIAGFGAVGLASRARLRVTRGQLGRLLLLGMLSAGTSILLASSYAYIPVGCATVIHFLYPTLTCLVMLIFFGARLTVLRVLAMVFSLAGLVLVTGGVRQGSPVGVLLALCSSFTFAGYTVLTDRFSSLGALPTTVRMLYINVGCLIMSGTALLLNPQPASFGGESALLLLAATAMIAGAMTCFVRGIDRIGATSAAFFSLFEPLTSMVVSTVVYHYSLGPGTLLGCCLVLAAVLFVALSDREEQRRQPEHRPA